MQSAPLWFVIGTALFPLVSLFYPDLRRFFTDRLQANKTVGDHIDPILKTADELYSKIYDLAKTDFKAVYSKNLQSQGIDYNERIYVLYLFASFFGRISILRQQNHYSQISKIKKGKRLLKFLMSFESKTNSRITSRANQRLIGDAMIKAASDKYQLITLFEFKNLVEANNSPIQVIVKSIDEILKESSKREVRQRILYFGVLVKAFIDYFDSRNNITKRRQATFTNKLSDKTKYELRFRLFALYLSFVKRSNRYYQ